MLLIGPISEFSITMGALPPAGVAGHAGEARGHNWWLRGVHYIEMTTPSWPWACDMILTLYFGAKTFTAVTHGPSADRSATMAKRVLGEIMTGINAKKAKRIDKKVVGCDKGETSDDSECPSTPVKSKPRSQPVVMSKTPKERVTGKGTRRSLILDRCNFLASSDAELDSSKASSDDGSSGP